MEEIKEYFDTPYGKKYIFEIYNKFKKGDSITNGEVLSFKLYCHLVFGFDL